MVTSAPSRYAREFVKDLEAARPRAILDLIYSAETFRINLDANPKGAPQPRSCQRCGYICSQVRTPCGISLAFAQLTSRCLLEQGYCSVLVYKFIAPDLDCYVNQRISPHADAQCVLL